MPDGEAGFDGLSQADLIAQQEPLGKPIDDCVGDARLVRPGTDGACLHPQAISIEQVRHIAQELENDFLPLIGIDVGTDGRMIIFLIIWLVLFYVEFPCWRGFWPEFEQFLLHRLWDRHGHPVALFSLPQPVKPVADLGKVRRSTIPRIENHE